MMEMRDYLFQNVVWERMNGLDERVDCFVHFICKNKLEWYQIGRVTILLEISFITVNHFIENI
jgi:hypothetical protein